MTTHRDAVRVLGRPHRRNKLLGAALAALAAVLCAVSMVGMLTWAEDANWFVFVLAGFGVVGFGTTAFEQWREWTKGEEPAWLHWLGAAFWTAFGLFVGLGTIYALVDGSPNPAMVVIAPVIAVSMLFWAYVEARTALRR